MDISSLLGLQDVFQSFCLTLFPTRVEYISSILDGAFRLLVATCQRLSAAAAEAAAAAAAAAAAGGRSPPSLAKLHSPAGVCGDAGYGPPVGAVGAAGPATAATAAIDTSSMQLKMLPEAGMEAVGELLTNPLKVLSLQVLNISSYAPLMDFLDTDTRSQVAKAMVDAVVTARVPLTSSHVFSHFLALVYPLIRGDENAKNAHGSSGETGQDDAHAPGAAAAAAAAAPAAAAAQHLQQLAMLVHLAKGADTDEQFNILLAAKNAFSQGGALQQRVLLPPLAVAACRLLPQVLQRQTAAEEGIEKPPQHTGKRVCQLLHAVCLQLVPLSPETALRMLLLSCMAADNANIAVGGFGPICEEFASQALVCFEEEITDSKTQFAAITQMVGCFAGFIVGLEREIFESLATKMTQHAAKLLKKVDQCRAVLSCSHLYWNTAAYRDSRRVLECLQKCLKIADLTVQTNSSHVSLFIEILNKYVYYFDQNNTEVTTDFIQNLLALCAEHCRFAELDKDDDVMKSFRNTLQHLRLKKQTDTTNRYKGLDLSIEI
ncbi:vacuolar sorting protein 35, putative [Eimeria maxima]|uniref:Vacuolar sorting protein 35, putative n=1 Tax=Eimeria maxima TaxID=5804 RepID=U6MCC1_EIMMA|nr:vacuolar sorting protein 35, putative [Eimeria maxima]CDJ59320.1 vacuolar sorting protein 35, putative [Eimeria maxima]